MRAITPGKKLVAEFTFQQEKLPIHLPVAQYQRVSTDGQVTASLASLMLQDEKLRERLLRYGWKIELIVPIATDLGKSGQKFRHEREGLDELFKLMQAGKIGAVACYDVSRLFRDLTRSGYTEFVNECIKHHVPVVTYKRVYFPSKKDDVDRLYDDLKEAADRIQWFKDVPLEAKYTAIEEQASYGGHRVPMGFVVVGETGKKHYTIYEPHATLIRWLYKRFYELNGALGRLFHEVCDQGFYFPAFQGIEKAPHVALDQDAMGNYRIKSRRGLISILTNPAYIGMYHYNGVGRVDAHAPIVERWLFDYAFSRLSAITLDGEENEQRPKVNHASYKTSRKALLEGILYTGNTKMYPMAGRGDYEARPSAELVIPIAMLDEIVCSLVCGWLIELEMRKKEGEQDILYERLIEAQKEQTEAATDYAQQLANIDKSIQEWEMQKRVAKREGSEPDLTEAIQNLKRLRTARAEVEEMVQDASKKQAAVSKLMSLLKIAVYEFDTWPFERKQQFIRMIIEKINIVEIAPHALRLDTAMRPPFHHTISFTTFRHTGSRDAWTSEEIAILKRLYKRQDRLDILQALPLRSWDSIKRQAALQGWERETKRNTSGIHDVLTYADAEVMRQMGYPSAAIEPWKYDDEMLQDIEDLQMFSPPARTWTASELVRDEGLQEAIQQEIEEIATQYKSNSSFSSLSASQWP